MAEASRSPSFQIPDSRRGSLAAFRLLLTFEYVFESTGRAGPFQIIVLVLTSIVECSIGLTLFTALTERESSGWSWDCLAVSGDFVEVNVTRNESRFWCPPPESDCTNLYTYLGDTTTFSTEWNLICDQQNLAELTTVLFFAGSLGGSMMNGQLSDLFGRRNTTLVFWVLMMALQSLTAASNSWTMYLAFRIGAGICMGCCSASASVLAIEYMCPKGRIVAAQKVGLSLSLLITALLTWLVKNWRYRAIASGLLWAPTVPILFIFLPESARWLLEKDRVKQAEELIKKMARYNRGSLPNRTMIHRLAEMNKRERQEHHAYTYKDLFANNKFAGRSFSLFFIWFTSYLLFPWWGTEMREFHLAAKIALEGGVHLIGKFVCLFIANRFGRKKTFIGSICMVSVFVLTRMLLDLFMTEAYQELDATLSLLSMAAVAGVQMITFCLTMETYPTLLRSIINGASNTAGETGVIAALYVTLLSRFHKSVPYVIHLVLAIVSAILVAAIFPETRDRDLPEQLPVGECSPCCRKMEQEQGGVVLDEGAMKELEQLNKRDYHADYHVMDFTRRKKDSTGN